MWDIAHTSREDLAKRNLGDFITLYGLGGVMGAGAEMLSFIAPNPNHGMPGEIMNKVFKSSFYAAIGLMEVGMTGQLKGKAGYPKPQPNKAGVLGVKWWFTSLPYLW